MSPNLGGNFDASSVDPTTAFDPLPPGWYAMQIVNSEIRQAKNSDGQYVWLELEVLEQHHPDLKGRRAWERLNLWNSNQQAVEISQRTLSAICRATGEMQVADTEQLHHKPLAVKLKVRPAEGNYEASNDITGYDSIAARFPGGAAPPAAGGAPTQSAPAGGAAPAGAPSGAAPASSTPPWQKKG